MTGIKFQVDPRKATAGEFLDVLKKLYASHESNHNNSTVETWNQKLSAVLLCTNWKPFRT